MIIEGPAPKPADEEEEAPAVTPPQVEAKSYLDDEPVVAAQKLPRQRTGKKMKLPKRVKEGRSRPLLAIIMILLLLILAGVLLVQHVPEARKHYDNLLAEILGKPQEVTPDTQRTEDFITVEVGAEKVLLKKGTDTGAAVSYANSLRKVYEEGKNALSAKER